MEYTKIFPSLMKGKKLMYIHGFGSSAQSGTVSLLRTLMPHAEIIAYDLPLHPAEAMQLLRNKCEEHKPDLIIGTSMGGMYAEMLKGYDRILVNPAFEMGETMIKHGMMGKQVFQNPREDGMQEFIVTKALVGEYKEITTHLFQDITKEEKKRVVGMFGDADPVVHTYDLFRQHYDTAIRFHGEHRVTDSVALHYLIPVVRWIDDRQEGRERSIVYIDATTLMDAYGKPKSSLHKAYELLIEHYDVFIVAPSPTATPQALTDMQAWVEEYLNVPAYNRVVFVNEKKLLYGDFLISTVEEPDFIGTTLLLGSSEFKTWEELIIYFERIMQGVIDGGQD